MTVSQLFNLAWRREESPQHERGDEVSRVSESGEYRLPWLEITRTIFVTVVELKEE